MNVLFGVLAGMLFALGICLMAAGIAVGLSRHPMDCPRCKRRMDTRGLLNFCSRCGYFESRTCAS